MTKTSSVGFIGLGYMGHGMARNILAKDFPLTAMAHRKREAVEDLVLRGAHKVGTVRELAVRSGIVLLCVTGPEQVDDLARRKKGLGQGARLGTIAIDCTTSVPETLLKLARDFARIQFVDAPAGRSPKEAWSEELPVTVGCPAEVLDTIHPVLAALLTRISPNFRARWPLLPARAGE